MIYMTWDGMISDYIYVISVDYKLFMDLPQESIGFLKGPIWQVQGQRTSNKPCPLLAGNNGLMHCKDHFNLQHSNLFHCYRVILHKGDCQKLI